jgi:hypothetical protein
MTTSKGKEIIIVYISKTDKWECTFLSQNVQQEFTEIAEKYEDTLKPNTATVAMK